jgi:thiol:disulfide interchange protein
MSASGTVIATAAGAVMGAVIASTAAVATEAIKVAGDAASAGFFIWLVKGVFEVAKPLMGWLIIGWFVALWVFVRKEEVPHDKVVVFMHVVGWPVVLAIYIGESISVDYLKKVANEMIEKRQEARKNKKLEEANQILRKDIRNAVNDENDEDHDH